MGPTAEELKDDIEQKRVDLGEHLEALGDRVSPAQIAHRKQVELRFRLRAVLDNPAALGGISLLIGLIVGARLSRRRSRRRASRRG